MGKGERLLGGEGGRWGGGVGPEQRWPESNKRDETEQEVRVQVKEA